MTSLAQANWPAHAQHTHRCLPDRSRPIAAGRAEELLAAEWECFASSTTVSREHNDRASRTLPPGVTSSFQHWEPYPISTRSARGAWLTDIDGRELLDLSMGFGAMLVGHLNPIVVDHVEQALHQTGTLFVTPPPQATDMSERFCRRFGLDMIRFTNTARRSPPWSSTARTSAARDSPPPMAGRSRCTTRPRVTC